MGPAPPAVNDARVATVLDLKQHLPPTSKIGEGRCYPLFEEGLQFPTGMAKPLLTLASLSAAMRQIRVHCQAPQVKKPTA